MIPIILVPACIIFVIMICMIWTCKAKILETKFRKREAGISEIIVNNNENIFGPLNSKVVNGTMSAWIELHIRLPVAPRHDNVCIGELVHGGHNFMDYAISHQVILNRKGSKKSMNRKDSHMGLIKPILPQLPMMTRNLDGEVIPYSPPVTIYHQESHEGHLPQKKSQIYNNRNSSKIDRGFRKSETNRNSIINRGNFIPMNRGISYQGITVGRGLSEIKRLSFQEVDVEPVDEVQSQNQDDLDFEFEDGRVEVLLNDDAQLEVDGNDEVNVGVITENNENIDSDMRRVNRTELVVNPRNDLGNSTRDNLHANNL